MSAEPIIPATPAVAPVLTPAASEAPPVTNSSASEPSTVSAPVAAVASTVAAGVRSHKAIEAASQGLGDLLKAGTKMRRSSWPGDDWIQAVKIDGHIEFVRAFAVTEADMTASDWVFV